MNGIFGEAKVYQVLALLNKILIHPMNKFELIDGMMTIAGVEVDARDQANILMAKSTFEYKNVSFYLKFELPPRFIQNGLFKNIKKHIKNVFSQIGKSK